MKFLFLGKVCHLKGLDVLLDAFACLKAMDWHLTIAGSGELATYTTRANHLGISDKIDFLGWVDEKKVGELLTQSDVFILPSYSEMHPVSLIEAMSYKLAVIVTPVGTVPEFITDKENGLLVAIGSKEETANAIQFLLENPQACINLGNQGYRTFVEQFEMTQYAEKMHNLYEEILAPSKEKKPQNKS